MSTWATRAERDAEFNRLFVSFDFLVRDEFDNGEFLTSATVDLIENGKVVYTETFTASSEDAPGEAFSAYGNGRDNHAGTQARSFAWAWIESKTTTLEDRLGPGGIEWQREKDERNEVAA